MDWKPAVEEQQVVLMRIAALLFALADLAERTCGRSQAVRGLVLWLLLPAEVAVRNLVTNWPAPMPFRPFCNSPADAMRLARSFRELAAAVQALSRLTLDCADDAAGPPPRVSISDMRIGALGGTLAKAISMALGTSSRAPHDTS